MKFLLPSSPCFLFFSSSFCFDFVLILFCVLSRNFSYLETEVVVASLSLFLFSRLFSHSLLSS